LNRAVVAIAIAVVLPAAAGAQGSMPAGSSSELGHLSQREDVPHRAAEAYNRGIRELKKARDAKDPADQKKHYTAAQGHFRKSLDLLQNFDALLGMGQADLALGDSQGALTSCLQALGLKPNNEEAKSCADTAKAKLSQPVEAAPPPSPPPPSS
jgi:tetratricopeptide (TPR) repeat protein